MSREDLLGDEAVVRQRLDAIAKRLSDEFAGIHTPETVKTFVDESARQYGGGGVNSYVTILAERFARERLRAQAQATGQLTKDVRQVFFVSLTGGGRAQIGAALLQRRIGTRSRSTPPAPRTRRAGTSTRTSRPQWRRSASTSPRRSLGR